MAPPDLIPTYLAAHATPVPAPTPDSDPTLPASLTSRIMGTDDPLVVGVGEPTHGSREVFRLKHALIRGLITQTGFRTVAFEADTTAVSPIDAAVRSPTTPIEPALHGLTQWLYRTETILDLLEWIATYNQGRLPEDQVRVHGIDVGDLDASVTHLSTMLDDIELESIDPTEAFTAVTSTSPSVGHRSKEQLATAHATAAEIGAALDDDRDRLLNHWSHQTWAFARHLCRVIKRTVRWHRVRNEQPGPHRDGMAERDRVMSENVQWALTHEPGNGVAVWAHNSHIQRGTFNDGQPWSSAPTMGEFLSHDLGPRYVPVGVEFGSGRFRAVDATTETDTPTTFEVGDPREPSLTAQLGHIDDPPFAIDLQSANTDSRLGEWLADPHRIRWIGTVFDPTNTHRQYLTTVLPSAFDALVYLPESTPTHPL